MEPQPRHAFNHPITTFGGYCPYFSFSPDGLLIVDWMSSGEDSWSGAQLWDLDSVEMLEKFQTSSKDQRSLQLQFAPNGQLFSYGADKPFKNAVLKVWDETRLVRVIPIKHLPFVKPVPVGNRRVLAVRSSKPFMPSQIVDIEDGRPTRLFPEQHGHHTAIAFSPELNVIAIGTEDGKITLWNPDEDAVLSQPLQHGSGIVQHVTFSSKGGLLASCGGDRKTKSGTSVTSIHRWRSPRLRDTNLA